MLENFSEIPQALKTVPQGSRWDILAIDEFMTAEIVSTGKELLLGMYAEVAGSLPQKLEIPDPEIQVEERDNKIYLRALVSYPVQGSLVYKAMIQKINTFRKFLGILLQTLQQ